MDYMEFYNNVSNLSNGWTNWYWANEQLKTLNSFRKEALRDKKKIKNELHIDVKLLYKEIDAFEECLKRQSTLTNLLEERYTLAAYEYAINNKPIISYWYHKLMNQKEVNEFLARYKFDVSYSLITFYIFNEDKYPAFYSKIKSSFINFLNFCSQLQTTFPNAVHMELTCHAISVMRTAIKQNDTPFAMEVLNAYNYKPTTKREIKDLDKIKEKLLINNLLN